MSQTLFAFKKRFAFVCLLLALVPFATAQESGDYLQATGFPTFGVTVPVELGYIDLANGNLHLEIPIANPPQRGSLTYNARFVYDSRIWQPVPSNGNTVWAVPTTASMQSPGAYASWSLFTDAAQLTPNGALYPAVFANWSNLLCNGTYYLTASKFSATNGATTRYFDVPLSNVANSCEPWPTSNSGYATDGSGYQMYVTMTSATTYIWKLIAPDGTDVTAYRDTNGNEFAAVNPTAPLLDTLGRTPVTVTANGSQTYYDVANAQGSTSRYTVTSSTYTVSTSFNQPNVTEATNVPLTLVSSIGLPDGTSYQFTYDSYGELASITLPTGGTINYSYTNFVDPMANVNRWLTGRTSAGGLWSYALSSYVPQNHLQTSYIYVTVTAPSGDSTVYSFATGGGVYGNTPWLASAQYPTGYSIAPNFDFSHTCSWCNGAAYVHLLSELDTVPAVGGGALLKQTAYSYDSPQTGHLTAKQEWNFINPTRQKNSWVSSGSGNLPSE